MPGTGWHFWTTVPGSRWVDGSITRTPYVRSNRRRASGSLATPFWAESTGVEAGACRARSSRTACVCCDFTATRTDGVLGPRDVGRGVGGRRVDDVRRLVGVEGQPTCLDRGQVLAAGDEGDVVPGAVQVAGDHPADGADAVDDVLHYSWVGRLPRTIIQAITAVPDSSRTRPMALTTVSSK